MDANESLQRIEKDDVVARIWARDHTVWKQDPTEISDRLGWLTVAEEMTAEIPRLQAFASAAAAEGLTRAVLLGMGGSSLAPEVLRATLGVAPGALDLSVLDSTHPRAVAAVAETVDPERTLFVVASKSGTTLETLSHFAYFFERAGRADRFVAITDPGTPLESLARERGFREVFLNPTDIGGRYSALSLFGLVPAALIGADLGALLRGAVDMAAACRAVVAENPGASLGATLGAAALEGRDKLTLVLPASMRALGAWIEQLIAESTGKEGRGILPVDGEPVGTPDVYGNDRLFVSYEGALGPLRDAGHPVVTLDPHDLGAEFFRWEFATAVAGAVLEINPFDQPNVAEAKEATAAILSAGVGAAEPLGPNVLEQVRAGDYVAIQAYLEPSREHVEALQRARVSIRDEHRVATTLGFGPRYLHSTGQLHKGGPNTGVFLQVVDDARAADEPIPDKPFTFGRVIEAQALGDLRSLRAHGRRAARTRLEPDGTLVGVTT